MDIKDFGFNGFENFEQFVFYAEAHYLPMLDRLSERGSVLTDDDRRLLGFLHNDITGMVNEYDEEGTDDGKEIS